MATPTDYLVRDAKRALTFKEKNNTPDTADQAAQQQPVEDDINHPSHYQSESGLEVIEAIESFIADPVSYMLGNVMKYISRGGKKAGNPRVKDLRKARWYLDRAVTYLERHGDDSDDGDNN